MYTVNLSTYNIFIFTTYQSSFTWSIIHHYQYYKQSLASHHRHRSLGNIGTGCMCKVDNITGPTAARQQRVVAQWWVQKHWNIDLSMLSLAHRPALFLACLSMLMIHGAFFSWWIICFELCWSAPASKCFEKTSQTYIWYNFCAPPQTSMLSGLRSLRWSYLTNPYKLISFCRLVHQACYRPLIG